MWGVLTILPLCLPLATLLSSMMVIGQLAENNELMAIRASGVSFSRVMAPLMISSFIIAVGAYIVGDKVVPRAFNEIYTLRDDIGRTKNEIKIPSGTFYDGIEGYVLRVDGQNKKTGMLYGVMAYDHSNNKGNTSVTIADSAIIRMSRNKDYLTFTLFNGTNYIEDIVNRGHNPIILELLPGEADPEEYGKKMQSNYSRIEYEYDIIHEKDTYEETLETVRKLNPLIIVAGSERGVILTSKLSNDLGLLGTPIENLD
jgi:lipopolysaccharide export LptBFGC system permease protein LptF